MNDEPNTESQNPLNRLKVIFKDKAFELIGTLLSGSTISYVISRMFIKSYLTMIGFDTLIYDSLVDNNTVTLLAFSTFLVFLIIIFTFSFVPMYLRFIYNDTKPLFQNIHDNNIRIINWFLFLCFLLPLGILGLIYLERPTKYYIYTSFTSIVLFLYILFNTRSTTNNEQKFKIFFNGFIFSGLTFLALIPFLKIIEAVISINVNEWVKYIVISAIWIILSAIYGFRITKDEPKQYFLDIMISIFLLISISVISTNTIRNPIAEFVGIKDRTAHIYKVSADNFIEIDNNIKTFWKQTGALKTLPNKGSEHDDDYYLASAKSRYNGDVYFLAQIIFRDGDYSIICPPFYEVGKNKSRGQCFIIKSDSLEPTPLNQPAVNKNPNFIDKVWIPMPK